MLAVKEGVADIVNVLLEAHANTSIQENVSITLKLNIGREVSLADWRMC